MDTFLVSVLPQLKKPHVNFRHDAGVATIRATQQLTVEYDGVSQTRGFPVFQKYSLLGKTTATRGSPSSDLEGINRDLLSAEGQISFEFLERHVKARSGMQTAAVANHINLASSLNWSDNQVALLVNILRYGMLKLFEETAVSHTSTGELPEYDDGHVVINRNRLAFDRTLPNTGRLLTWPGSNVDANYPVTERFIEFGAQDNTPIIDLRGLNQNQAFFVIAMLGSWQRGSRYRLDFTTGKLTNTIRYRANTNVEEVFNAWLSPGAEQQPREPVVFTSVQVFDVLRKYVAQNRLYTALSSAVQLVSEAMCMPLPDTAEGQAWLMIESEITLPPFEACRGRYNIINEGLAAMVSQRGLREFQYIAGRFEILTIYGMLLSDAYALGVSMRGYRICTEMYPADIHATEHEFLNVATHYAAYASEGLRIPVPTHCYSGVGVVHVPTGYPCSRVFIPVVRGRGSAGYCWQEVEGTQRLRVEKYEPCGWPVLLTPCASAGVNTPYQLNVTIDIPDAAKTRVGAEVDWTTAWSCAWLARLCGYNLSVMRGNGYGVQRYYAANNTSWTHPMVPVPDEIEYKPVIYNLQARENQFIFLPNFVTKFSNSKITAHVRTLTFELETSDGVRAHFVDAIDHINFKPHEVTYPAGLGTADLRGSLIRESSVFRIVPDVTGGTIPQQAIPVRIVGGTPLGGLTPT